MKKEKTIKLLADGSVAKVGRIVVVIATNGGNNQDAITKITALAKKTKIEDAVVLCKAIPGGTGHNGNNEVKELSWYEEHKSLMPATKEQRMKYYADLQAKQN